MAHVFFAEILNDTKRIQFYSIIWKGRIMQKMLKEGFEHAIMLRIY